MDFLIADDEKPVRDAIRLLIEHHGHYAECVDNGENLLRRLREEPFDAVLLDMNLGDDNGLDVLAEIVKAHPNVPVVMFTAAGSVKSAVEAVKRGAVDFLEKPFRSEHFMVLLSRITRLRQKDRQIESLQKQVSESKSSSPEAVFQTQSPAMESVMSVLMRSAKSNAGILILGESGTGKSMVARAVHDASNVAHKPFVTVSCPSLSRELLQSELFGHMKGSFTGAMKDHWGKVKAAEGGTLFLDEIGELPMEIQPKLLRLLQEREYERVGETVTRKADVRIIAATNRDIQECVASGEFREDLYYRLNVISVQIPPLRERPQDVVGFAEHYLRFFAKQCRSEVRRFAPAAVEALLRYPWPGNLRELRNAIERAVILTVGPTVQPEILPQSSTSVSSVKSSATTPPGSARNFGMASLEALEAAHIRHVVASTTTLQQAASILGIDQATLYRKRKLLDAEAHPARELSGP